jgi:hypothetical protein
MIEVPAGITSMVSVGDGSWSIELTTGYLKRGDGRPLGGESRALISDEPRINRLPRERGKIETGVKPDHMIARPSLEGQLHARSSEQPRAKVREPIREQPPVKDPELDGAMGLLREWLKKT